MKRKVVRIIGLLLISGIVFSGLFAGYLWFKPHRNIQEMKALVEVDVDSLIGEFSENAAAANAKYLSSDGNSMVIIVRGPVSRIMTNQDGEKVLILTGAGSKAGVNATFTKETSSHIDKVKVGDFVRIKGAITAGNSYDPDLDLYEDAVIIQCEIVR